MFRFFKKEEQSALQSQPARPAGSSVDVEPYIADATDDELLDISTLSSAIVDLSAESARQAQIPLTNENTEAERNDPQRPMESEATQQNIEALPETTALTPSRTSLIPESTELRAALSSQTELDIGRSEGQGDGQRAAIKRTTDEAASFTLADAGQGQTSDQSSSIVRLVVTAQQDSDFEHDRMEAGSRTSETSLATETDGGDASETASPRESGDRDEAEEVVPADDDARADGPVEDAPVDADLAPLNPGWPKTRMAVKIITRTTFLIIVAILCYVAYEWHCGRLVWLDATTRPANDAESWWRWSTTPKASSKNAAEYFSMTQQMHSEASRTARHNGW